MAYVAWSTLVDAVKLAVFPELEAENLVANHDRYVLNGVIDLQLKVQCLQINRQDSIPFCSTFYHCGATVFNAPRGFIHQLYTTDNAECCDKVVYRPTTKGHIDCMLSEAIACATEVDHPYQMYEAFNTYYAYPDVGMACVEYARGDVDKACRAEDGWFTLYRGELWVYPHINSDETIMLVWDGVKRDWEDIDLVDDDPDVRQALELYLGYMAALKEDCDREKYLVLKNEYDTKVADMMWNCEKEMRLPRRTPCFNNCG